MKSEEVSLQVTANLSDLANFEQGYKEICEKFQTIEGLKTFFDEYEKGIIALKNSIASERNLLNKCQNLQAIIVVNEPKVFTSTEMTRDGDDIIKKYKQAIEKKTKETDVLINKISEEKIILTSLKNDFQKQKDQMNKDTFIWKEKESGEGKITYFKEEVHKLAEEAAKRLEIHQTLLPELEEAKVSTGEKEREISLKKETLKKLKDELVERRAVEQHEKRKKIKLENVLNDEKNNLISKNMEIERLHNQIELCKKELIDKKNDVQEVKMARKMLKETIFAFGISKEAVLFKLSESKQIREKFAKNTEEIRNKFKVSEQTDKMVTKEIKQFNKEIPILKKTLEDLKNEISTIENKREEINTKIEEIKQKVIDMKIEEKLLKKSVDSHLKTKFQLVKAKKLAITDTHKVVLLNRNAVNLCEKINDENQKFSSIENYQQNIIKNLNNQCQNYSLLTKNKNINKNHFDQELHEKSSQVSDIKYKIQILEKKLKNQLVMYETVRSDRGVMNKKLLETQEELFLVKRDVKYLKTAMEKLAEDIVRKEIDILECKKQHQLIKNEINDMKKNIEKNKRKISTNKAVIDAQFVDERKLQKSIGNSQMNLNRIKKDLNSTMSERDRLKHMLVKNNHLSMELYDKLSVQQTILKNGERIYNHHLVDIVKLKEDIRFLKKQNVLLLSTTNGINKLKQSIAVLNKYLLIEKNACTVLKEDFKVPINIHRWRRLQLGYVDKWKSYSNILCQIGRDPMIFDVIFRIKEIQDKIRITNNGIEKKESLILKKEVFYIEYRRQVVNSAGIEMQEQKQIYESIIKNKFNRLNEVSDKIHQKEEAIKDIERENNQLNDQIALTKKNYKLNMKLNRMKNLI